MEDLDKKAIIYKDDNGIEYLLSFNEFYSDYWHEKIFGYTLEELRTMDDETFAKKLRDKDYVRIYAQPPDC